MVILQIKYISKSPKVMILETASGAVIINTLSRNLVYIEKCNVIISRVLKLEIITK